MLQLVIKHGYSLVSLIKFKLNVAIIKDSKHNQYVMKLCNSLDSFSKELHYYELASKYNLAPQITYDRDDLIIISEKMNSLVDEYGVLINKDIINDKFIQNLDNKINIMHNLGFAHGDLAIFNIVYDTNNNPFIIDFEKSYQLHNHTWKTELWMREGFEWEKSYEDFVNHDHMLWKEMLMIPQTSSFNTIVNENYYVFRFNISNYNICCGTFAKCLQNKLGGTIYGISDNIEGSVSAHYVLLTNKFIDCTGIYTDEISMLKMVKSKYEDELEGDLILYEVDQYTLNNKDYECDFDNKEIDDIVEYIINILNCRV